MKNNVFFRAIPDGFLQGVILFYLNTYSLSIYISNYTLWNVLLISGISSLLSATIYFLLIMKEPSNKRIVCFSLSSLFWFVLSVVVILIIQIAFPTILQNQFPISIFPLREELNNADGLWGMLVTGAFVLFSFVLKLILFLTFIIRNIYKSKDKNRSAK